MHIDMHNMHAYAHIINLCINHRYGEIVNMHIDSTFQVNFSVKLAFF